MSTPDLSRRDADRIIDAPAESDHPVGHALQALCAPGTTAELLREDATIAQLRAARLAPAPRAGSRPGSRSAALGAVTATGLVVALTSGGFALAATGRLPDLPDLPGQAPSEQPSRHPSERVTQTVTQPPASPTGPVGGSLTVGASPTSQAATGKPSPKPTQAATGKPATKPTQAATGKPATKPTQAATGKPATKPTQAATGKPATKPTQAATGKPTAVPSATGQGQAPEASTPQTPGKPSHTGKPSEPGKPESTGRH